MPGVAAREVESVSMEVAVEPFGFNVGCENAQDAAVGKFVQPSVTVLLNPVDAVTEIVKVAVCPEGMVAVLGCAVTEKPFDCSLSVFEVAVVKSTSPLYKATSALAPGRSACEKVATPEEFSGEVPSDALLSVNVTVPVGTPADELAVAVSVTGCPATGGFGCTLSATAGVARLTTCEKPAELAEYRVSPLYAAVITCVPANNVEVENDAASELTATFASTLAPSLKVTVPVGAGAVVDSAGVIVAVSVIDEPNVEVGCEEPTATAVASWIPLPTMATTCGLPAALSAN